MTDGALGRASRRRHRLVTFPETDPLLTQVVTRGQLVERRPFHRPSTVSALGSIALDRTFDRIGRVATSRRPAIVEPDFGQINDAQGGHQLRVCGQVKATSSGHSTWPATTSANSRGPDGQPPGWPPAEGDGIPLRSDNSPHRRPPAVNSMATQHNSARHLAHPGMAIGSVVASCNPGNRFGLGVLRASGQVVTATDAGTTGRYRVDVHGCRRRPPPRRAPSWAA